MATNAIIALCHFCDAHGPRAIFCTYAYQALSVNDYNFVKQPVGCKACSSLGPNNVFITKELSLSYCSREVIPNNEASNILKNAAIRSLTCEISWSKEGGLVYFNGGDDNHIISLTFQLKDSQARGLKRWFSLIVMMKDKLLILSLMPFFAQHFKTIIESLQKCANEVYDSDQKVCSQRALRLNSGTSDFGPARSLPELTDDKSVFEKLHTSLCWLLKSASSTYSETLYTSNDFLSIWFRNSKVEQVTNALLSMRTLKNRFINDGFKKVIFCALCGIDILIECDQAYSIKELLLSVLPTLDSSKVLHIRPSEGCSNVNSLTNICLIRETGERKLSCSWAGILPEKCPTLITRIESAIANEKMNENVLNHHISSLKFEWINLIQTLKAAISASGSKSASVLQLKKSLGISPHDELLVNYWINFI